MCCFSEISLIVRDEVKDPRLEGLTIIKVDLSKDIKKAYVFFSTLNSFNDTEFSEVEDGLKKAKGFIRSALSKRIKIKRIPELSFESHGGNIEKESRKLGIKTEKIIDASASIVPFKNVTLIS